MANEVKPLNIWQRVKKTFCIKGSLQKHNNYFYKSFQEVLPFQRLAPWKKPSFHVKKNKIAKYVLHFRLYVHVLLDMTRIHARQRCTKNNMTSSYS